MAAPSLPLRAYRPLIMFGGIVLVAATLYWAQRILIPLVLATLLTFILSPAVALLQHAGLRRVLSVILVTCLSFLLLSLMGMALTLQGKRLAAELPGYKANMAKKVAGLRGLGDAPLLQDLQDMLKEITAGDPQEDDLKKGSPEAPVTVRVQPPSTLTFERVAAPAAEFLATAALVVVLVVFMLIQREDLRNRLVQLIGHGRLIHTTRAFEEAARRLSRFLLMQLLINAGFGVTLGLGLFLLRVPYPLLWGILVAVLRFVPYVGTWLALVAILLFSFAVMTTWTPTLLLVALVAVLEVSTANVVEPLLFGHSTGVSPIALLVAAAFWTWLWGPIGLVLSTPLTACLVVLGRYVPRLEFLGVLLGDTSVVDPEVTYYQRLLARDQDEAADVVKEYLQTHAPEAVYDEVLVPALILAKRDRDGGELGPDDERFIFQVTEAVLDDVGAGPPPLPGAVETAPGSAVPPGPKALVFACPACDEADELALQMLRRLLPSAHCQTEVVSAKTLVAEVVSQVEQEGPSIVCVGALPPGGLAQARYLCKRLRASFPDLKIVVVRWGLPENAERRREELVAAGANFVATTLLEAQAQVAPLVSVLAHVQDKRIAVS